MKPGDIVRIVQNRAGGSTTLHGTAKVTKVSKLLITLDTGEQFLTRTHYVKGATPTRGIGKAHERRIELIESAEE